MTTLLDEAIEAWVDARQGVIAEAENIDAKSYRFSPATGVRDVSDLLLHIMEVSLMMVGELTRADGDFQRAPFPRLLAEYRSPIDELEGKRAILAALRSTLRSGVKSIEAAGELHMLGLIRRFDGKRGTRLEWFHHGIAQEMYHRGQLALYARLLGTTPALTRRIRGEL